MADHQGEVGGAHLETFAEILPCETMAGIHALAHAGMLVEVEVDAVS